MKVLIISGFLGAGKTTFIRELIRRTGIRPAVLENEFGEVSLDAREVKEAGAEKVLEFMQGCVCCSRRDSFSNTILAVSAGLDPEYLIVEPSGVGRLGSILEAVAKVSYERIRLLPPVVVVSPRAMDAHLAAFPEIYRDQLLHAGRVILSKTEHALPEDLEAAVSRIRQMAPGAAVEETHYGSLPDAWWESLLQEEGVLPEPAAPAEKGEEPEQLSLKGPRVYNPGRLLCLLEDLLRGEYGQILRAKGILASPDGNLRFDLADGLYAVTGAEEGQEAQCVLIGRGLREEKLRRVFREEGERMKKMRAGRRAEKGKKG